MSISANFPNVRPSLLLDFANSQQLDPRVTFSRSTTAPYYDGKTSVLAEQNLTVQSQDWTQSVWTKTGLTVTANNWVAPDGTTTGTLLTSTTSTAGSTGTYQSITFAIGSTISFYATAGTANFIGATVGGVGCYANFNLGTGAVASSTGCTPSMVSIGGGTYRCIIANTSISGTLIILTGKDADPAASPWTNGVWTSGNTVKVWGFQVENRSSPTAYNATTTTAITNYIPQLLTAPINAPRFDFNPTTGESLGLLIEQSSTNLQPYSQDFSNAYWLKSNSSIISDTVIAPDGTQTVDKLVENSATSGHYVYSVNTLTAGSYTYSFYAKASGRFNLSIGRADSNINFFTHTFNLNTGTTSGGIITSVGNNMYRCSGTITVNTGATTGIIISMADGAGATTYAGNGFDGIFIWGAQLEALPFATSYIPTTSAQVTRASDNASMTGTNFSSWYNQSQGTFYISFDTIKAATNLLGGEFTNQPIFYSSALDLKTYNGSTGIATLNYFSLNTIAKGALSYSSSGRALSLNGGTVYTSTGLFQTISQLLIGQGFGGYQNGHIQKIAFYTIQVTNAQLQALTGS